MKSNKRTLLNLAALALTASLAACGGGGGGGDAGDGGNGGGAPIEVVAQTGNLQTTAGVNGYVASTMKAQAFDAMNAHRVASGAGYIYQSAQLDTAAQKHGDYVSETMAKRLNGDYTGDALTRSLDLHTQYGDLVAPATFYATTNPDRTVLSGFASAGAFSSESLGGAFTFTPPATVIEDGEACIKTALNTVYHAEVILSRATHVGLGRFVDEGANPGCVVHVAATNSMGQVPGANNVIVNPAPSATVNGTFYIDAESPRPAAGIITTSSSGSPIMVNLRNATYVNAKANGPASASVSTFTVRDSLNNVIDGVLLAGDNVTGTAMGPVLNKDSKVGEATVFFMPRDPLAAGTYTVTFAGTTAGEAINRVWSFTAQ